ncbi:MAG: hypothetical protein ABIJ45_06870, partial [Candidatus Zixiibacteriota bacterium]
MAVKKKAKPKTQTKAKPKAKKVTKKAAKPIGNAWKAAEIQKLRAGYKTKPASQLAKELNRSLASVRGKISALGLTKGPVKKKATKKAAPKKKAVAKKKA